MAIQYSIQVYKQYFNFAAAHFLVFENGEREPLHGHNYRVKIRGEVSELKSDMVFDFLDIKPIVKEVCDSLDHLVLLPKNHATMTYSCQNEQLEVTTPLGDKFSFPRKDCLLLPLENTSAERLAIYINSQIRKLVKERFQFCFQVFEVEVEETPGQSALYVHQEKESL